MTDDGARDAGEPPARGHRRAWRRATVVVAAGAVLWIVGVPVPGPVRIPAVWELTALADKINGACGREVAHVDWSRRMVSSDFAPLLDEQERHWVNGGNGGCVASAIR